MHFLTLDLHNIR